MNAQSGRQRALGCRQTKEIYDRTSLYHLAPTTFLQLMRWQSLPGGNSAALRCLDIGSQRVIAVPVVHGKRTTFFLLPKKGAKLPKRAGSLPWTLRGLLTVLRWSVENPVIP